MNCINFFTMFLRRSNNLINLKNLYNKCLSCHNTSQRNSLELGLILIRKNHRFCIIGSGPAGFYAAQHLQKVKLKTQKCINF